ncbi:DUF4129 domain-containing protein [Amycolatopsis taiwanensis]|uniref:DUF4129 domain-containing protein n=1 Tax=Amycolatopsis taiwanensis TaxID=342230 RepID=UPI001FE1FB34|nr:DUF4129 domain-containing protein [Amycolatopsis taiwanensis]
MVIDRDDARRAAETELSGYDYQTAQPNVVVRALTWLGRQLDRLFTAASSVTPGGALGLLVLLAVVVLVVVVIRLRVGKFARAGRVPRAVFEGHVRLADDYRRAAEEAAAAGDFAGAVRERFRAIVRELEETGVLEEMSGRTADEAAREAGRHLPHFRDELLGAARLFDAVHYGGQQASIVDYERLAALDRGVHALGSGRGNRGASLAEETT